MAGALSGHPVDSFERDMSFDSSRMMAGNMSFNPNMHSTQGPFGQPNQSFWGTPSTSFQWGDSSMMSEESARRITILQDKLNQKLGPEFISQRPGMGGGKFTYVEGWKVINLANEVFGFNGWNSSIVSLTTDFVDFDENRKSYNVGVTAIMRVTLRDGTYHEDVGYGILENSRQKGAALDKCKKEAVTDGLKRALRNLGNLLGNCLYDKSFTQEVTKIKVPPTRFNKDELHRRPEFEDVKPNIDVKPNMSASSSSATNRNPQPPRQNVPQVPNPQAHRPQAKPTTAVAAPHMRTEVNTSRLANSTTSTVNAQRSPIDASDPLRQVSFAPPPQTKQAAVAKSSYQRNNSMALPPAPAGFGASDPYDFCDDDDLFASADLGTAIGGDDTDIGRGIDPDVDMGRPIDTEEGLLGALQEAERRSAGAGPSRPSGAQATSSKSSSMSLQQRIEAALVAESKNKEENPSGPPNQQRPAAHTSANSGPAPQQQRQPNTSTIAQQRHQQYSALRQDQNMNLNSKTSGIFPTAHSESVTYQAKKPEASVGGFNFPPGLNPLTSNSEVQAGMKRPADTMMSSSHRGMRPGMGLQQASGNSSLTAKREILGSLDVGNGGDVKRLRR